MNGSSTVFDVSYRENTFKRVLYFFFDFTAFKWVVVDLFYRGKVSQQQVRVIILLYYTLFTKKDECLLACSLFFLKTPSSIRN